MGSLEGTLLVRNAQITLAVRAGPARRQGAAAQPARDLRGPVS